MTSPSQSVTPSLCSCGDPTCTVPYGYCHCGCGKQTKLMKTNSTRRNLKRGEPMRYWLGHNPRRKMQFDQRHSQCVCLNPDCRIPYGLCHCGCGQKVGIAKQSVSRLGLFRGMPRRYASGHSGSCHRGPLRPRTHMIFDEKEIIIIPMTRNYVVKIDAEDEWKVPGNWHDSRGYASQYNPKTKKILRMHRVIMNCPDDMIVDHINGDRRDNRKCNLRIIHPSMNNWNNGIKSNNISGVSGVGLDQERNKWVASIRKQGVVKSKRFDSFEEAVEKRRQWEVELFGELRRK